jgi:hypothetical protein
VLALAVIAVAGLASLGHARRRIGRELAGLSMEPPSGTLLDARRRRLEAIARTGTTPDRGALASATSAEELGRAYFGKYLTAVTVMVGLVGTFAGLMETLKQAAPLLADEAAPALARLSGPLAGLDVTFGASLVGILVALALALVQGDLALCEEQALARLEELTAHRLVPALWPREANPAERAVAELVVLRAELGGAVTAAAEATAERVASRLAREVDRLVAGFRQETERLVAEVGGAHTAATGEITRVLTEKTADITRAHTQATTDITRALTEKTADIARAHTQATTEVARALANSASEIARAHATSASEIARAHAEATDASTRTHEEAATEITRAVTAAASDTAQSCRALADTIASESSALHAQGRAMFDQLGGALHALAAEQSTSVRALADEQRALGAEMRDDLTRAHGATAAQVADRAAALDRAAEALATAASELRASSAALIPPLDALTPELAALSREMASLAGRETGPDLEVLDQLVRVGEGVDRLETLLALARPAPARETEAAS